MEMYYYKLGKSVKQNNNCYFSDTKTEECISLDSLLTIISHLHKNLDDSKSSVLEAQTIEGFILEKYPQFRFENGTAAPESEDDVYLAASLLLLFVCVNSKDADIKQAMCSQLSGEDQETIMRFSKALLVCSTVTHLDVQTAITEACGQDVAAACERSAPVGALLGVGVTPPALRSLHGEVRRLQAALDAERFDRNYLQDELARNSAKMDKLLKDKEQYKLEISELKTKMSLCCGGVAEAHAGGGGGAGGERAARLARQLQDTEDRLVATQEMLDEAQADRNEFKAKMEELRRDRDKWLELTQSEGSRAAGLTDELEVERRRVQALQELVAELRLHNRNNGALDGSQLECDDPDASGIAIHNASVCSEACASIIEVQLSEERAKVAQLSQQLLSLQDQLADLTQRADAEKLALKNVISEKDSDIYNLKHRINEEIEEKNQLKERYNDEVSMLNNDINEIEQKLNESTETSRATIEQKLQEIQVLQEEKLSLLQSLQDETTKHEGIMKTLREGIDTEKNLKVKMKEEYENRLMKLNEKVLNRNNELVELQNKVFDMGETIEQLNIELKKERENNNELFNKHNEELTRLTEEKQAVELTLHKKTEESKELQKRLLQNVAVFDELNKEIDDLKAVNEDLTINYRALEINRNSLRDEIIQRDSDVDGIRKEIENITYIFSEEKNKFMRNIEERNSTISALQMRLHDEIQYKGDLETELHNLHQMKSTLSDQIAKLNEELKSYKAEIQEKDRSIYALDLYLKEEKHTCGTLKAEHVKLTAEIAGLTENISANNAEIACLQEQLSNTNIQFEEELHKKDADLDMVNSKLLQEVQQKKSLQNALSALTEEKEALSRDCEDRNQFLVKLQEDYDKLVHTTQENIKIIATLGNKIETETQKYLKLEVDFDTQTSNLMAKLNETEKSLKEMSSKSKNMFQDKDLQIQTLRLQVDGLSKAIEDDRGALDKVIREKQILAEKLEEEIYFKTNLEKEYQNQCAMVDSITSQLTGEITLKSKQITSLQGELNTLLDEANQKTQELKVMELKLLQESEASKELEYQNNHEIKHLKTKIDELQALNTGFENELKKEIAAKTQAIDALQRENEQLHFTIEEDNSNHEILLKEKDVMIEGLEEHLKCIQITLESIRKDYEDATLTWETTKLGMNRRLEAQHNQIEQLKAQIAELKRCLEKNGIDAEKVQRDLQREIENMIKSCKEKDERLEAQATEYQTKVSDLERDSDTLRAGLDTKRAAAEALQQEHRETLKLNEGLADEAARQQSVIATLQMEKEACYEQRAALTHQLTDIKSSKELLKQENSSLLTKNKSLQHQLAEAEAKENDLLVEKDHLQEKLIMLESEKDALITAKQAVERQLAEASAFVKQLLDEKDKLLKQFESIKEEKLKLHTEKEELKEEIAAREEALSTKASLYQKLEESLQTLETEKHTMELVKNSLLEERDDCCERLDALRLDLIDLEQRLVAQTAQTNQVVEENDHVALQLEQVERERGLLQEAYETLQTELSDHIAKGKALSQQKEALLEQLSKVQSEKAALFDEKQAVEQQLFEESAAKAAIAEDKDMLAQQLESLKDTVEKELRILEAEKLAVDQLLLQETNEKNMLEDERNQLKTIEQRMESEMQALQQRLDKEKVKGNILQAENESLADQMECIKKLTHQEKETLVAKLNQVSEANNKCLEERAALMKDLVEQKTAYINLELEYKALQQQTDHLEKTLAETLAVRNQLQEVRDSLIQQKEELIKSKNESDQHISKQLEAKTDLQNEICRLNDVVLERQLEKDQMCKENNYLKQDNAQLGTVAEALVSDKEELHIEKEKLLQSLSVEKASRDEFESEKNAVSVTLQELRDEYAAVSAELKLLNTDLKKHEDISVQIASILTSGVDKLLQSINKEEAGSAVLRKLVGEHREDMSLAERCDLVVNVAQTLYTELSLCSSLEKALEHESSAASDLQNLVKQKDIQLLDVQAEVTRLQQAVKDSETVIQSLEEVKVSQLQDEVKRLEQALQEGQAELSKQTENHNTTMDAKLKDIQTLQRENKCLTIELTDAKIRLDSKVHSLKEKLVDNENLTEKLKRTYEYQIENLNVMVTKLTSYLKEKTIELESVRREKEKLQDIIEDNTRVINYLEEEYKTQTANQDKLISDFESERLVLKNMVVVTESIMEDQKHSLNNAIADHERAIDTLKSEKRDIEQKLETTQKKFDKIMQEKQAAFDILFKEHAEMRIEKEMIVKELETEKESLTKQISVLKDQLSCKTIDSELLEQQNKVLKLEEKEFEKEHELEKEKLKKEIENLQEEVKEKVASIKAVERRNKELTTAINELEDEVLCLQEKETEHKLKKDSLETELLNRIEKLTKVLSDDSSKNDKFKYSLQEKIQAHSAIQEKIKVLTGEVMDLVKEKNYYISKLDEANAKYEWHEMRAKDELRDLKETNNNLTRATEDNKTVITNLEQLIRHELEQNQKIRHETASDTLNLESRCALLQEYQLKAETQLLDRDREIAALKHQLRREQDLEKKIETLQEELAYKNTIITKIAEDKDEVIQTLVKELNDEKGAKERYQMELERKAVSVYQLRQKLDELKREVGRLEATRKENDDMTKAAGPGQRERDTFLAASGEGVTGREQKPTLTDQQVSTHSHSHTPQTSDLACSLLSTPERTIADLEKILYDRNRTITTLQSDISYLKSLMADSENKLLDVTKELEISKETCEQLSTQLKKLVHQKNEEIAELKNKVSKMSVTENRATQIIKVSAKYQAIILKRISDIKSNTVLKELTNFGNTANCDSELKRNLNSGSITLEDLENFLETTDRHLKRCSESRLALQKERDRLTEVNKINESEMINLKKFLAEVSVSLKTFSSIKDLYTQKVSKVVSVQRTVRREILSLDGQLPDSAMCKLERGYAAVMQDLCECTMNLERWVERSVSRSISTEKLKQALMSGTERASLACTSFQNASLEVQLDELQSSFEKLLEEVLRAQKGRAAGEEGGPKETPASTVMEVRAEYEDKLNRMKAKMKQLYQEQIQVFRNKQKEETATLEQELQKTREKLSESCRAYEDHIKALTTELWSVGEKFLMKKDEAEWLRKRHKSGSLMSLQHIHSTGLQPHCEEPSLRQPDTLSLRSLPAPALAPAPAFAPAPRDKRESRGLHMSDEEGEVFDNRWLKELQTPKRDTLPRESGCGGAGGGLRLSELKWRNSLCPPHLKSSYPAETQFAFAVEEDEIKFANKSGRATLGAGGGGAARKEVGITAYKKPGPPTPSKQAGRLSATDSELRESGAGGPAGPGGPGGPAARKTNTPSRLRSLFRSAKGDTLEGTPRKRLSNIFRKK